MPADLNLAAQERLKTGADSRKGETEQWARRVFRPTTNHPFDAPNACSGQAYHGFPGVASFHTQ
jgi:hypothetical protein